MRKAIVFSLGLVALLAALGGGTAGAEPVFVGTDDIGDWGANLDTSLGPIGDALGMDLATAAIESLDDGSLRFEIGLNSLPASGGTPEVARYVWAMTVNGEYAELDGKFSNYSRGACDPTSGACPPPRDPGPQPFFVRGDCDASGAVLVCREIGLVRATFDPATATISIPVPRSLLGTGCLEVGAAESSSLPGGSITSIPSVFFSQAAMPSDNMILFDDPVTFC